MTRLHVGALVLALTLMARPAWGQAPEDEIRAVEEQWRVASLHADTAAFNRLMAPDHYGMRTDGLVTSRDDRLKAFGSGNVRTASLQYSDMRVRVYGSAAVVTGLATRVDTVLEAGRPTRRDFQYRYVRVWTHTAPGWRCTVFSSTTVDPGHVGGLPHPATADTNHTPHQ